MNIEKKYASREETNESVKNQSDKLSIVSFELVDEYVMEGCSAIDENTNK
jgi:hypothetical protein